MTDIMIVVLRTESGWSVTDMTGSTPANPGKPFRCQRETVGQVLEQVIRAVEAAAVAPENDVPPQEPGDLTPPDVHKKNVSVASI
jgi:hypothetical protein